MRNLLTSDKRQIQQALLDHYREFFGRRDGLFYGAELQPFLDRMPHLSDSDIRQLEVPITLGEIEEAMNNLAAATSPGPDGFTAEFYKRYKDLVWPFLLEYIQYAYKFKELPALFLQDHFVLLPKSSNEASLRPFNTQHSSGAGEMI